MPRALGQSSVGVVSPARESFGVNLPEFARICHRFVEAELTASTAQAREFPLEMLRRGEGALN